MTISVFIPSVSSRAESAPELRQAGLGLHISDYGKQMDQIMIILREVQVQLAEVRERTPPWRRLTE